MAALPGGWRRKERAELSFTSHGFVKQLAWIER